MKTDPQPTGHKQSHSYHASFFTSAFSLRSYNNHEIFYDACPLFSILFCLPPLLYFQISQIKLCLFQPPQLGPTSPTCQTTFFYNCTNSPFQMFKSKFLIVPLHVLGRKKVKTNHLHAINRRRISKCLWRIFDQSMSIFEAFLHIQC